MANGILCPECGDADSGVKDSRAQPDGWRRRRLCACGHRFTTLEVTVHDEPVVIERLNVQGGQCLRVRPWAWACSPSAEELRSRILAVFDEPA